MAVYMSIYLIFFKFCLVLRYCGKSVLVSKGKMLEKILRFILCSIILLAVFSDPSHAYKLRKRHMVENTSEEETKQPCTCGVFLSGQFNRTTKAQPKGEAAIELAMEDAMLPCGKAGSKSCASSCIDVIIKHLPKASQLVCGAMDRDVHKERAFLFIKNCDDLWKNTNFSAGKEFCCKDGEPYKCNGRRLKSLLMND